MFILHSFNIMSFSIDIIQGDENGNISYGMARNCAREYNLETQFLYDYGLPGDWEDLGDGSPIGVNLGELREWINSKS